MEPAYSFTLPSIEDETPLDCRLYHPEELLLTLLGTEHTVQTRKAAVIAHPYAPLGGSLDDPVVLATTDNLIRQGYIVATFNFRGAAEAKGHTSWSAHGEKQDYITTIGFILQYLNALTQPETDHHDGYLELLLAGYSYGSLILSKLPPLNSIKERFDAAALGTSIAEVILRAKRIAIETVDSARELELKRSPRGRPGSSSSLQPSSDNRSRAHSLTVTVGGEESEASGRRHSRSSPMIGMDVIKKGVEVPQRIRLHLRRHNSSKSEEDLSGKSSISTSQVLSQEQHKTIKLRYLLISPLLPPLSLALMPSLQMPTLFGHADVRDPSTGFGSLSNLTLLVYGDQDGFTSSKKLGQWIGRLQHLAPDLIHGVNIEKAGHFWRETGVMKQLQETIRVWLDKK